MLFQAHTQTLTQRGLACTATSVEVFNLMAPFHGEALIAAVGGSVFHRQALFPSPLDQRAYLGPHYGPDTWARIVRRPPVL